jgi:Domain of unknown function (DUF4129)
MKARCTLILAGLLIASCFCLADSGSGSELTVAEYHSELDQLLTAAQQLDSSGRSVPPILKDLPPSWRVRTDDQDFEISTEGLRQDVRKFTQNGDFSAASAIRSRIEKLRDDLDGFETSPQDASPSREHLTAILARPEFRDVRGPSFIDRLAQRILAVILSLLGLLFQSSAIPTISKLLVYALIGLAVLIVGYLAYRKIKSSSEQENVVPLEVTVSAKSWELWLADARAAANQDNWREAVHLAYWAAISFLEHKGAWRPDRARTPREYLRLMSASNEDRDTLAALTQIFELTWYAKRKTDAATFAQTIQSLERLGCRLS